MANFLLRSRGFHQIITAWDGRSNRANKDGMRYPSSCRKLPVIDSQSWDKNLQKTHGRESFYSHMRGACVYDVVQTFAEKEGTVRKRLWLRLLITRSSDQHFSFAHDLDGTRCMEHDGLRNGSEKESFDWTIAVRPHEDQISSPAFRLFYNDLFR